MAVQHPLQPYQPLSLPDMQCTVLVKIGMMPGLLLMHDALYPCFVLKFIDIASAIKCRVQPMAQVDILSWASHKGSAMMRGCVL